MMTRQLFSLRESWAFWSIPVALLVGLVGSLVVWGIGAGADHYMAAASLGSAEVRIDSINCLSIGPRAVVFDQKDYSDPKLGATIADILSIKTVLFNVDYGACPWGFFATIVPGLESAVRLHERPARFLISVGICERTVSGTLIANRCLNKNLYVFNSRVEPHELLSIALVGLKKTQAKKWEVFQAESLQ